MVRWNILGLWECERAREGAICGTSPRSEERATHLLKKRVLERMRQM